jgi:transcriptional regulator with XRE-family HTH domain
MNVRDLRQSRGWTQDQLAEFSGLSIRTIQRIEQGHRAGFESLKSLAATFEIDWNLLKEPSAMLQSDTANNANDDLIAEIRAEIRRRRGFYIHLSQYIIVIALLFAINLMMHPKHIWAGWAALGWGIGLVVHGLRVLSPFQAYQEEWEKRQIQKHLQARARQKESA